MSQDRIPVTVLTGFLGAGKTTLLNRILKEHHGRRIAVIENEFGEIGIDHELVVNADEEVFEMNNGCICCTVRGDLIRILTTLMKRRDRFDHILVETTGLADPGPVAQTFFVDPDISEQLRLDGIVTVVDARHIVEHLDDSPEAQEQIAFADTILLNKIDLADEPALDGLERRIRGMNATAAIHHTRDADIDLQHILDLGGFDLERALDVDPQFMEPEYPFEWAGRYQLEAGQHELSIQPGPDPAITVALIPAPAAGFPEELLRRAEVAFSGALDGETLTADAQGVRLPIGDVPSRVPVFVPDAGDYTLLTEHRPDEFDMQLERDGQALQPGADRTFKADHEHDDEVSSVGITVPGDVDPALLNAWLSNLLATQGADIFRMKGVLSIRGQDNRVVFQGVHMLFDSQKDRPWGDAPRQNALVFIGRNLDRRLLTTGFEACLA